MRKRNKRDKDEFLYDDILTEDLLREAAEAISRQYAAEMDAMENDPAEVPEELDRKILQMAREYDAKHRQEIWKKRSRTALRTAAVFVAFVLGIGAIGMSTSEAFRMRIFSMFENRNDGAVAFRDDAAYELLKDWTDYWYPEYLPEGYYLLTAEKNDDFDKIILFKSTDDNEIRIYETNSGGMPEIDKDTNLYEEIYINSETAYLFSDIEQQNYHLLWQTEDRIFRITFSNFDEKEEIIRTADSLKYIK